MSVGDLNVALILKLVNQVTGPARAVIGTLNQIGDVTEKTGRAGVAWSNQQLAANQARRSALMGEAFGVAALAGSLAAGLKPAIDFQRSMAEVAAVARADDDQLTQLTATARELGATTPWAASEAAAGMKFLAMAGFETNETIQAMPGMLNLASAGAIGLGEAADIASNILTGFGMQADEMGYLGDVLTSTFTSSNTDLNMLGTTMKYVAPNAEALGVSLEQTAAMVGKLGDAGIQGSQAGTALRAMMTRLAALPKPAADALAELGVQTVDTNGNLRDLPTVLAELDTAMSKFGTGDQAGWIADIFGLEAASAATVLMDLAGSGELQTYAETLKETGSAARVATMQNDNAAGSLKRLQSILESVAISVGTVLLPEIVELIETVTPAIAAFQAWADAHPELIGLIFRLTAGLLFLKLGSIALRWALFSLLTPILHIIRAASWLLVLLPRLGRALFALLNPLKLVRGALVAIRMAFMATGIGALIAGIAMAGVWIYNNWSGLQTFFVGFWESFREALGPAGPMLDDLVAGARRLWSWLTMLLGPLDATKAEWLEWGKQAGAAIGTVIAGLAGLIPIEWSDYIPEINWVGLAGGFFLVSTLLKPIIWTAKLLGAPIKWALLGSKFLLSGLLTPIAWTTKLLGGPIAWSLLGGKFALRTLLKPIVWGSKLIPGIGWAVLAGELLWHLLVTKLGWGDYLPKVEWSEVLGAFSWADWVPEIDWSRILGAISWPEPPAWLKWLMDEEEAKLPALSDGVGFKALPEEQQAAVRQVETTVAAGELPTETYLVELQQHAAALQSEIAAVKANIDQLGDGPMAATLAMPMQQELSMLQGELEAVEAEMTSARTRADSLTQALMVINETDVRPEVDASSIDQALVKAARLASLLQNASGVASVKAVQSETSLPGRDRGGPVRAGFAYRINERGEELFVPRIAGTVLPNRIAAMAGHASQLGKRASLGANWVSDFAGQVLPGKALKAAVAASSMAAPVGAMPSGSELIERLDQRPAMSTSAAATAPQITREGDTISINIYPTPGMSAADVAREVKRVLARRDGERRGDLHDGVDY